MYIEATQSGRGDEEEAEGVKEEEEEEEEAMMCPNATFDRKYLHVHLTTASYNTYTGPGQAGGPWETRQANVQRHHHHHQHRPTAWSTAAPPPRHTQERPYVEDTANNSPPCSCSSFWA